jgi:hypothetical protein
VVFKERRKEKGINFCCHQFFSSLFFALEKPVHSTAGALHRPSALQIFTRYNSKHKQRKKTHGMVGKAHERKRKKALLIGSTTRPKSASQFLRRSGPVAERVSV